jgi:hypothetical protein
MHNKSLQLSPRRPPDAVRAVPNAMQCGVDSAGQLNSMLSIFTSAIWVQQTGLTASVSAGL